MNLHKKIFVISISIILSSYEVKAQVYHYITGQIIPNAKAGDLIMKTGTFLGYDADFGVLIVPENRRKPYKLINIPVIKVNALDSVKSEPVFLLNGGPGTSNIWNNNFPEDLLNKHDIIMVGYRGVEGSVILECPDVKKIIKVKNIFEEQNFKNLVYTWEEEASKFQRNLIDIEGYSKFDVIQDIEDVRVALEIEKINFYAFSYGTMIAQLYIYYYANNINKMVFIGARPFGYYLHDPFIINNKINLLIDNLILTGEIEDEYFDTESIFRSLKKNISFFEESKFGIAAFQQLYSYNSSKNFINSLIMAKNEDYKKIIQIYTTYSDKFTNELVLGDYAVKTSCSASFYDYDSISFFPPAKLKRTGHFLTESINRWYLTFNLCYRQFNIDYSFKENSVPTLFISAEYDFIAPYEFIKSELLPIFENYEFFLIPNQGHDDLIKNNSRFIQNKIIRFYDN